MRKNYVLKYIGDLNCHCSEGTVLKINESYFRSIGKSETRGKKRRGYCRIEEFKEDKFCIEK